MKNIRLCSLISLLAFSICACAGTKDVSSVLPEGSSTNSITSNIVESSSESTHDTSSGILTEGWNETELGLINQYAYGEDIPYPNMQGNSELVYDEEYEELFLCGAQVTASQVRAYADLFEAYGWEGGLFDEEYCPGLYGYEIEISYNDSYRYLDAFFYTLDGDYEYAESGEFYLEIYDPYFYEWPIDIIQELAEALGSKTTIPSFDADIYQIDTDYFAFGVVCIYCYIDSDTAEEDYAKALTDAGFVIDAERDEYGYYCSFDAELSIEVDFAYDPDYGDLDIFIYALGEDGEGGEGQDEGEGTITEKDGVITSSLDFTVLSDGSKFTSQTVGEITFSSFQTTNTANSPTYYANGNALRVYWGNGLSFACSNNYEILEVNLTLSSDGTITPSSTTVDVENGQAIFNDNSFTIKANAGASEVSFELNATKGNMRFTSISVSYKAK